MPKRQTLKLLKKNSQFFNSLKCFACLKKSGVLGEVCVLAGRLTSCLQKLTVRLVLVFKAKCVVS